MYKFFVKSDQIQNENIIIDGPDVNHIKNVLRLKIGETLQVCNTNIGKSYLTKIVKLDQEKVMTQIIKELEFTTEPSIQIDLFQGIPKQEKMEWIIQKTTELGIHQITPIKMENCVVKLDDKQESKKIERWKKIAEVAAKQSKRDYIPNITHSLNVTNLCKRLKEYDMVLLAYEQEKNQTIRQIVKQIPKKENLKIGIIVGPEGGITKEEWELIKILVNVKSISLGRRILRTETAGMFMVSIMMYEFDEME